MPLAKPLYLTSDFSDLSEEETKIAKRAIDRWAYRNTKEGLERERRSTLAKKFSISLEDYDFLFSLQGRKCAICGEEKDEIGSSGKEKPFAVDHDHSTGKIRGILCSLCNRALGQLKDSPDILASAIRYLKKPTVLIAEEVGYKLGENIKHFRGRRSPKERTDIKTEDIVDFYNSNQKNSLRKTAEKFGLSDGQILQRMKKAGAPRRSHLSSKFIHDQRQKSKDVV